MTEKYGYLGPQGTYSEEALALYLGQTAVETVTYPSIAQVISAVDRGDVRFGLVPLENSIEGTVNIALDLIAGNSKLKIVGEVVLPIRHNLLAKPGTGAGDISLIVSHPQAIAQCRNYLTSHHPGIAVSEVNSTGEAARMAFNQPGLAAIANESAATHNGLQILENDIQDCVENSTRFVCIATENLPMRGPAKTSVVISITDRPGGLYQILREFALANINLTKIESRPAKRSLGDYIFFVDFIGHPDDPEVSSCLDLVGDLASSMRILGSYPAWGSRSNDLGRIPKGGASVSDIRQDIDIIDCQIVDLLAKRTQLVSIIGNLKKSATRIRDNERESEILKRVKNNALRSGVDPILIEKVFKMLFDHFVDLQVQQQRHQSV